MTHTESSRIACELKQLAHDYIDAEQHTDDFETADALMRGAAQVRFVATMVTTTPGDSMHPLGEAWISAGRRFLDALLERARMDEQHESRASRHAEKADA